MRPCMKSVKHSYFFLLLLLLFVLGANSVCSAYSSSEEYLYTRLSQLILHVLRASSQHSDMQYISLAQRGNVQPTGRSINLSRNAVN